MESECMRRGHSSAANTHQFPIYVTTQPLNDKLVYGNVRPQLRDGALRHTHTSESKRTSLGKFYVSGFGALNNKVVQAYLKYLKEMTKL